MRRLLFLPLLCIAADPYVDPPLKPGDKDHWAFVPPRMVDPPMVKDAAWGTSPIDRFIQAKLEGKGLKPAPPATRRDLVRRLSFDLTGLPPTPADSEAFLKSGTVEEYSKLVDKLLASPHFGDRWAMHWLDVVRYAESNGFELDADRPHAWRYRDYVIDSFNADKPYDRFLTEQLAGDELAKGKDPKESIQLWAATGMHRCGQLHAVSGNIDPAQIRNEVLTEMVQGVGSAVLGLTVNCARCHDHKFDPISQGDYYRLEAFFAAAKFKEIDFSTKEERDEHGRKLLEVLGKLSPIKAELAAMDKPYADKAKAVKRAGIPEPYKEAIDTPDAKRTPEQKKLVKDAQPLLKVTWDEVLALMEPDFLVKRAALRKRKHDLEAELPMPPATVSAVENEEKTPATHILKRGEWQKKLNTVEPGYPRALGETPIGDRLSRLEFAKWLTRPEHPLTARVQVNRVWQRLFGRGIVATPNDFGTRGAKPTHPELLDWLALDFADNGWKTKRLIREIVLSNAYRMASGIEGDNALFARQNRKRMEGEAIRDAVLAASGGLNRKLGGPMVRTPLEPEVYDLIFTEGEPDGLWHVAKDATEHSRRSIYLFAKRNVRLPLLEAFDQPDRISPCPERGASIFAPQALILMNGPFMHEESTRLASALKGDKIADLYQRTLMRGPNAKERELASEFLKGQLALLGKSMDLKDAEAAAWRDLCLAVMNTNEFVFIP